MDISFQTVDEVKERLEYVYHWLKDGTSFFDGEGHFNHLNYFDEKTGDLTHYMDLKASQWCISINSKKATIRLTYIDSKYDIVNSLPYELWDNDSALENIVRQFKLFEEKNDPEL